MNIGTILSKSVVSKFINEQDLPAARRAAMALRNILPSGTKVYIGPEWKQAERSSLTNPFIFSSSMGFSASGHSSLVPNAENIVVAVKKLPKTFIEAVKLLLSSNAGYQKAMAGSHKTEDIIKAGKEAFSQLA